MELLAKKLTMVYEIVFKKGFYLVKYSQSSHWYVQNELGWSIDDPRYEKVL
jgi:hypothetical protein